MEPEIDRQIGTALLVKWMLYLSMEGAKPEGKAVDFVVDLSPVVVSSGQRSKE